MIDAADLSALPLPAIIEELDVAAIYDRMVATFLAECAAADIDYDVEGLQSDPAPKLLRAAAYRELMLRSRINETYRSRLLYFSTGTDLDNVADEDGITRLEGETDAALRTRARLFARGSSSAGPDDWWKFHAMTASVHVEDVAVTRVTYPIPAPNEHRGAIVLSILADTVDGVPSTELLNAVRAVVTSRSVRGVNVDVTVVGAVDTTVNITADIWLRPTAPAGLMASIDTTFRAAWAQSRALGWDVTRSWVLGQLHRVGVHRVELLNFSDVIVAPNQAPRLGTLTLVNRGVAS
jgi:phage-related baseplate assembly protein